MHRGVSPRLMQWIITNKLHRHDLYTLLYHSHTLSQLASVASKCPNKSLLIADTHGKKTDSFSLPIPSSHPKPDKKNPIKQAALDHFISITRTQKMSVLALLCILHIATATAADLRPGFYSESCPEAELIVREVMKKAMIKEPRSGASVMRLQFHDCFVNGCDASLLLDDTPNMLGEKLALSNINSLRSFEVIDQVKEALEKSCPETVSCADIIIMASRDAVALSGGPYWEVKLGRKDSLTASQEDSNNIMPSPRSNASFLIDLFNQFHLSVKDLVALSGSHSIGQGRCFSIMFRLYNQSGTGRPDPAIEPKYRKRLNKLCPLNVDQNVTGDLDATPQIFDNQYFKDLVSGRGFLNSDETLFTYPLTRKFVQVYSKDQIKFFKDFAKAMIKMGDLQSGRPGEIRRNCRMVNRQSVDRLLDLES